MRTLIATRVPSDGAMRIGRFEAGTSWRRAIDYEVRRRVSEKRTYESYSTPTHAQRTFFVGESNLLGRLRKLGRERKHDAVSRETNIVRMKGFGTSCVLWHECCE